MGEETNIAIIGGGMTGLLCALALRTMIKYLKTTPINILLFQDDEKFYSRVENLRSWILWPWAYKILIKYMGSEVVDLIKTDIQTSKLIDADSENILSQLEESDTVNSEDFAVYESGTRHNSLYTVVTIDLLRTLLITLKVEAHTNKTILDDTCVTKVKTLINKTWNQTTWFEDEQYAQAIPNFYVGYKLETYIMSAKSGGITLKFTNANTFKVDMLLGADGKNSLIRNLINSGRNENQDTGAICIYGLTNNACRSDMDRTTGSNISSTSLMLMGNNDDNVIKEGTSYNMVSKAEKFMFNSVCSTKGDISWIFTTKKDRIKEQCKRVIDYHNGRASEPDYSPHNDQEVISFLTSLLSELENDADNKHFNDILDIVSDKTFPGYDNQTQEKLRKYSLRTIAGCITAGPGQLSRLISTIIKTTSLEYLFYEALADSWETPLSSFTSPYFHPGRVMLLGDAAHTINYSSIGLGGAMVAIVGVHVFASTFFNLFGAVKFSHDTSTLSFDDTENNLLSKLGATYDEKMLEFSIKINNLIHDEMGEYLNTGINPEYTVFKIFKKLTLQEVKPFGYMDALNIVPLCDI